MQLAAGFLFAIFKPRDAGSCSFNVSVIILSIVLFAAVVGAVYVFVVSKDEQTGGGGGSPELPDDKGGKEDPEVRS